MRATLCACRGRWIFSLSARGLISMNPVFGKMRSSYEAMVDAEMQLGRTRRCNTTRPNAGHKPVFGPRISSAAGNRFKVTWKKLVLARMRAFRGDPNETLVYYLSEVMPDVWSELLKSRGL